MESICVNSLPPIFKISVILNILPFYYRLHIWKKLMQSICKETKKIWDQNQGSFIRWGRGYKTKRETASLSVSIRPRIEYDMFYIYSEFKKYESKFDVENSPHLENYNKQFIYLIEITKDEEVLIFYPSDSNYGHHEVHFWNESEISKILPSTNWPSYESDTTVFSLSESTELAEHIRKSLKFKCVIIWKSGFEVKVSSAISPVFWLKKGKDRLINLNTEKSLAEYSLWPISDWSWKPTKLIISIKDIPWNVLNEILNFPYISKLKYVIIERENLCIKALDLFKFKEIKEIIPNTEIRFNIWLNNGIPKWFTKLFKINSSTLIVVYKGKWWNFNRSHNYSII